MGRGTGMQGVIGRNSAVPRSRKGSSEPRSGQQSFEVLASALAPPTPAQQQPSRQAPEPVTARRRRRASAKPQPTPEERRAAVEEQLQKLEQAVQDLTPETYRQWLTSLPRLYQYSFGNLALVRVQRPDATRVQSFQAWKRQGRSVTKGEKGLKILVPVSVRVPVIDPATGREKRDAKGNVVKRERKIPGRYRVGNVFDITQTEIRVGDEAKAAAADSTGVREGAQQCVRDLQGVAEARGVKVFRGGVDDPNTPHRGALNAALLAQPNAGGYYVNHDGMECIVTRKDLSTEEEARVIAHELGHAMLHRSVGETDRHTQEVEAESVAFVLSNDYGIPSDYSAGYITNWGAGKDKTAELKKSSERIRQAVRQIYEVLDGGQA